MRILLACLAVVACAHARDLGPWAVEQTPGGQVTWQDRILEIKDVNGCTVWLRQELTAPVIIEYDAQVVMAGGPFDRLSDLNCFWMAQQSRSDGLVASVPPFRPRSGRVGALAARAGRGSDEVVAVTCYS